MKTQVALALVVLWSTHAMAVDTSGCSQTLSNQASVRTSSGKELRVSSEKSARASCWNARAGSLRLSLQWDQADNQLPGDSAFWVRVNGNEQLAPANVRCDRELGGGYQANTSSQVIFTCRAEVSIQLSGTSTWNVEIAPVLGGVYDTAGFGQNYVFAL